jgi:hypothetical protein
MRAPNESRAYPLGLIRRGLGVGGIHQWLPPETCGQGMAVMNRQRAEPCTA